MTGPTADRAAFAKLLGALGPYLDDLVFAGGWAHRLLGLHDLAGRVDFEPLATDDADLATPLKLPVRGEASLAKRLKDAGFTEELRGDDSPPITEYRLGDEDGGLYVEFIAPLTGGSTTRAGKPRDTAEVAGTTAQTLRHVDLLFKETWTVRLTEAGGFPVGEKTLTVRVPNAASFVAQKLLVIERRHRSKRAKDILYIHDTLLMFSSNFEALASTWRRVAEVLHKNVLRDLTALAGKRFGQVDDLVREAAQIAAASGRQSPPSPEQLAAACRSGLQQVLGRK